MKKMKLLLLTGLAAVLMVFGTVAPSSSQPNDANTLVATGDVQKDSIPTILPPL